MHEMQSARLAVEPTQHRHWRGCWALKQAKFLASAVVHCGCGAERGPTPHPAHPLNSTLPPTHTHTYNPHQVVALPLGSWVGGLFTTLCLRYLTLKGYRLTTVTPGGRAGARRGRRGPAPCGHIGRRQRGRVATPPAR